MLPTALWLHQISELLTFLCSQKWNRASTPENKTFQHWLRKKVFFSSFFSLPHFQFKKTYQSTNPLTHIILHAYHPDIYHRPFPYHQLSSIIYKTTQHIHQQQNKTKRNNTTMVATRSSTTTTTAKSKPPVVANTTGKPNIKAVAALTTTTTKAKATKAKATTKKSTTTTKASPKDTKLPKGERGERVLFLRDYLKKSKQAEKDGVEEVHAWHQGVDSFSFHNGKRFCVPMGSPPPQVPGPYADFLVFLGTKGYRKCVYLGDRRHTVAHFNEELGKVVAEFQKAKKPLFLVYPEQICYTLTHGVVEKEMAVAPKGSSFLLMPHHTPQMNIAPPAFYAWNKAMTDRHIYYHLMRKVTNDSASLEKPYNIVVADVDIWDAAKTLKICHDWCESVLNKNGAISGIKHPVPGRRQPSYI